MALLAIIVALASGCSAYRMKSATDLPEARLATIEPGFKFGFFILIGMVGGYEVEIRRIDGESTPWWRGERAYAVAPGTHLVHYRVKYGFATGTGSLWHCHDELQFEAQEGKQYILEADTDRDPVEALLKDKQINVIIARSACENRGSFW